MNPAVNNSSGFGVAQILNLLYRRFAIGSVSSNPRALELADASQVTNLRYGRLQVRATSVGDTGNKYTDSKSEVDLKRSIFFVVTLLSQFGCDNRTLSPPKDPAGSLTAAAKIELVPLTNMALIKAGTFVRLKYPVTLSRDFWLGKYEVTQAEYAAVMGQNPSHFKGDPNCPVEKLSYFDAVAYCSAVTKRERETGRLPPGYEYRLPSEAEWEYACRAGTTNFFSFGDAVKEADQFAWTTENSEGRPHPVGQKRPNPWGLHDMHGNVWEWCLDWFGNYPATNVTDPVGPTQGKVKVFRGGGWNNDVEFARSANRFMMSPSNGIYFVGFRIALSQINK